MKKKNYNLYIILPDFWINLLFYTVNNTLVIKSKNNEIHALLKSYILNEIITEIEKNVFQIFKTDPLSNILDLKSNLNILELNGCRFVFLLHLKKQHYLTKNIINIYNYYDQVIGELFSNKKNYIDYIHKNIIKRQNYSLNVKNNFVDQKKTHCYKIQICFNKKILRMFDKMDFSYGTEN